MPGKDVGYLIRSIANLFDSERLKCPNCGSSYSATIQRKKLITRLVRCSSCQLLYRIPTDLPSHNFDFYQDTYSHGFTTECPADESLQQLLSTGFTGSEKDYSVIASILRALNVPAGAKILDYGCSWGYGTWQLREAGYKVLGYEISKPRANYAREKLGLPIVDDLSALDATCDVFFSYHVIEHVPTPQQVINLAKSLTQAGGLFIAFTPNGSRQRLKRSPASFRSHWGYLHPNMLDDEFYEAALENCPTLFASSPYDLKSIGAWTRSTDLKLDLAGDELLVAAILNPAS